MTTPDFSFSPSFGGGLGQREAIVASPQALREFVQAYAPSADKWQHVATQIEKIVQNFEQEAALHTRTGDPMPVSHDTIAILRNLLSESEQACRAYAACVTEDCNGLRMLADAFEQNEEMAQHMISNI